jgi:hypothetical protein
MTRRRILLCVIGALALCTSSLRSYAGEDDPPPRPAPRYTIQYLPPIDDNFVSAVGINDLGHVIGESARGPFLWTPGGGYQFMGRLPGSVGWGSPTALNNSDQVVGASNGAGAPGSFIWSASTGVRELPVPLGGVSGVATGISDEGLVAVNAQFRSYVWSQFTGAKLLPPLPGSRNEFTSTAGVNRFGQIVGTSDGTGVIWDRGQDPQLSPLNDDVFVHISNAGHLANGTTIYTPGQGFTTIELPGQHNGYSPQILGINSSGIAVGRYDDGDVFLALVYFPDEGRSWDLNDIVDASGVLREAKGINDAGVIVGYGDSGAFILTPIPEPGVCGVLLVAGGVFLSSRRRHAAKSLALSAAMAMFIASSASADYRAVAFTGSPAPQTENGTTFLQFSLPILSDSGDVIFQTSLAGPGVDLTNDAAVYIGGGDGGPFQILQRKGAPADPALGLGPDVRQFVSSNVTYDFGEIPGQAVSHSQLASFAYFQGAGFDYTNDTAIVVGPVGAQKLAARYGDQAPGTPAGVRFIDFVLPRINSAGQFLLPARLEGPNLNHDTDPRRFSNDDGIWSGSGSGDLSLLARAGDPAPGMPGYLFSHTLYNGQAKLNTGGQVLLQSLLINPLNTNDARPTLYTGTPGNLRKVISWGDPTPGIADPTIRFRDSAQLSFNNTGKIVFYGGFTGPGLYSPDGQGIFLGTPGASASDPYSIQLIARSGTPAPGGGGLLFRFPGFPRLNDAGRVVFTSSLTRPGDNDAREVGSGVWTATSSNDLKLVLLNGTHAPGIPDGDVIYAFAQSFTSQGQILLHGTLVGPDVTPDSDDAWYLADINGVLSPLLREGDIIDPGDGIRRPASRIDFFSSYYWDPLDGDSPFNNAGQLAFRVTFSDNTQAIVVASVPEPTGTASALALASAVLVRCCRRTQRVRVWRDGVA